MCESFGSILDEDFQNQGVIDIWRRKQISIINKMITFWIIDCVNISLINFVSETVSLLYSIKFIYVSIFGMVSEIQNEKIEFQNSKKFEKKVS